METAPPSQICLASAAFDPEIAIRRYSYVCASGEKVHGRLEASPLEGIILFWARLLSFDGAIQYRLEK
jgi:hypothetical protein